MCEFGGIVTYNMQMSQWRCELCGELPTLELAGVFASPTYGVYAFVAADLASATVAVVYRGTVATNVRNVFADVKFLQAAF